MNTRILKTIKSALFAGAAISLSEVSLAHDFWLAPENYQSETAKIVDVSVMIGHPEDRLSWPLSPHRIVALRSIGPDGIQDHQASMADYAKTKALPIGFEASGLHILTIETTSSISVLEAEKFNAYVEEEGLTPIKIDRVMKRATDEPGRETYSRRGKALIQIGDIGAADPDYLLKPIGLTLEIVPLQNPARLKEGETFSARVYYRGVPISGATIGLIDLDTDDGILASKKTNASGLVEFPRPKAGSWMLHAVWSDTLKDDKTADYDTIFSSLSFAVK